MDAERVGVLNWRWRWHVAFLIAGAILVTALILAMTRGLATGLVGRVLEIATMIAGVAAWLGVAASFAELIRKTSTAVLTRAVGCWCVLVTTGLFSAFLFGWASERTEVKFRCRPEQQTVIVEERNRSSVCDGAPVWLGREGRVYAHAAGYEHLEAPLDKLPTEHGFHVVSLKPAPRWKCFLRGAESHDQEPFAGCGAHDVPWTRSRTWTLELVPRDGTVLSPSLVVRTKQPGTGIAIQSSLEDCYMNASETKDASRDEVELSGCESYKAEGGVDRYQVALTICAAGIDEIGTTISDVAAITVKERDGGSYVLEQACLASVSHRGLAH